MSIEQPELIVVSGMVIAYVAMCYAGVAMSIGRQLPGNISLQKWSLLFASLVPGAMIAAVAVGIFQKDAYPGELILMLPISVLCLFGYYLFQYWGARIIARGIIAGRNLLGRSSKNTEVS
ncbi:hypothetical protein [Hyphomonas sp.]|uniref:hypothetical protein n=1 Tax=Hyphomonas sp. TaxID=87 RepID=UPI0032422DCE